MPPLFSSTSLTTFVRSIRGVAKYIQQPATALSRTAPKRTINTVGQTRNAIKQVVHQTFPSLSTPAHQLHNPGALRAGAKSFGTSSFHAPTSRASKRPLGRIGQALQNGKRPQWGHGRSIPTNLGLGSARGFASAPGGAVHGNVPMVLRAFTSLLDEDNQKNKCLPRASRYSPYVRKSSRRQRRSKVCSSIDSSFFTDLQHYFPRAQLETTQVALPPLPEKLVTSGKITTLALPLSPSLEALLHPTNELSYTEASLGIDVLARLTKGLLPIHTAFSLHSSSRIMPLLTKLEALGVLDYHPGSPSVKGEVVRDSAGQPDILRLIFTRRSVGDVKALLGESLRPHEEGDWWALWELDENLALNQDERRQIMEKWGESEHGSEDETSGVEVKYPHLDASTGLDRPTTPSSSSDFSLSFSSSLSPTPSDSSLSSPSLSSSLFSSMSSEGWSIPPSQLDSDVDSVFSDSEVELWTEIRANTGEVREEREPEETTVWWAGAGEGFGFIAQPW